MEEQDRKWIREVFVDAANHFVDRIFGDDPGLDSPAEWEIQRLREGKDRGLLDIHGSQIVLDDRRYSLFTLNREYLPHIAEYVRLITQEGFDSKDVKFEFQSLDIVVFENDSPKIGIEVKRTERLGRSLKNAMLNLSRGLEISPRNVGLEKDATRKLSILEVIQPPEFRIVTPTATWYFEVIFSEDGALTLTQVQL